MKITIKDIAKITGLSIATVSMVINNKDDRISPETRQKVLDAIKDTGYVPNSIARSMITKSTKTIGLIIPDIANPFFPEIARGVEDKAKDEGFTTILCNSDNDISKEESYLDILQEKMVDGIIFTSSSKRTKFSDSFKRVRVPLITVDRDITNISNYGKIIVDNKKASYEAVKYMISRGLHRIAHITGPFTSRTALDRYSGYKKALEEAEIELDESLVFEGFYTTSWGTEAMEKILDSSVDVDSIFCGNDMIAAGVIKTLHNKSYSIPGDYSVVGFDDVEIAQLLVPELTTVRQPKYEMGYKAAELLINMINSKNKSSKGYILDSQLVIRKSVK